MIATLTALAILVALVAGGLIWFTVESIRYITTGQQELDRRLRKVSH